ANYDVYVAGDKFLFCQVASGGLNLDDVVFILGTLTMDKTDSYGELSVETYARGVDMKGNEVMVLVSKTINGTTYPSDGAPELERGYYSVADHSDRYAKKEGVKELTGFEPRYNKETKAPFVSSYNFGVNDMVYTGTGTYNAGYSYNQSTTAYIVVEGTYDQSTPLETITKTGSIEVMLDRNYNIANPIALLTKAEDGTNNIEAVVILTNLTTATQMQTIYISQENFTEDGSLKPSGRAANGYCYDVYDATTGDIMTITADMPEEITKPGFYRVAKNAEDGTWTFYLAGENKAYRVSSIYGQTDAEDGYADGIEYGNVAYSQTFDYISSNKMYGCSSDVIDKVKTVTGAKVIDLRSEVVDGKVTAITTVDQLSAAKTSRPNEELFFDAYVNLDGTDVVKTIFITDARKKEEMLYNNTMLYAKEALPTTGGKYEFYLAECEMDSDLTVGQIVELDLDKVTVTATEGVTVTTSALYVCTYNLETGSYNLRTRRTQDGGENSVLGYWGYTQGLHKKVTAIDGNTVTVDHVHSSCSSVGCAETTYKAYAPLVLKPNAYTAVIDLTGNGIESWAEFKAALRSPEGQLTDYYVDYYQPNGLAMTSTKPADCVPSLIVITDVAEKPQAPTILLTKDTVLENSNNAGVEFMVIKPGAVDTGVYELGDIYDLAGKTVILDPNGHTNTCKTKYSGCSGFFKVTGSDEDSITVDHLLPNGDTNWEYGMHNIITRWDDDEVVMLTDAHTDYSLTASSTSTNNYGCGMACYNYSDAYCEAAMQLDLSNSDIPVYDLVTGDTYDVAWLKERVKDTVATPDAIRSNNGEALLLSYWCADGKDGWTEDGTATPTAIFIMAEDAHTVRPNTAQPPLWRARSGDVLFADDAPDTKFNRAMKTEKAYGINDVDGRTGFEDGMNVYLRVNYYTEKKTGLFVAKNTADGFAQLVYQTPGELKEQLATLGIDELTENNAFIVNSNYTLDSINEALAAEKAVKAAVAEGRNGKVYVYVESIS
ncbi:MAG: hypothetical protein J6Q14_02730, partial [Oscillospiraceae bacterium]|nr:hypothetical protein [Oscillospiraceae bacterium]